MRILCLHGYYAFYPERAEEIADYCSFFEIELVRVGDYYTFPVLAALPDYSIKTAPYGSLPAIKTYEGTPWEIMQQNGFVYSWQANALVPVSTIVESVDLPLVGEYWLAKGPMIQAGARNASGQQVLSFDAKYISQLYELRVMEVGFE